VPNKFEFEESFVKPVLLKNCVRQAIASILLISVMACSSSQQSATSGVAKTSVFPQAVFVSSPAQNTVATNLVGLLLIKKDNLKNEFRGEIYPLALLLNDRYIEISNDVTLNTGNGISRDRILQINQQRIVLNAIKNFNIIIDNQNLGIFQVEKPIVSQFSCSSIITGQGNFQDQTSLQATFEQISPQHSGGSSGFVEGQKFDETWRTAIAINQAHSVSQPPATSEADLAQYQQAVLMFGKTAIEQAANGKSIPGEAAIESMQVVDLDQDGVPEIFGEIRQGAVAENASQASDATGFAAVWLTYKDGKPQLLETTQATVSLRGARRSPYHLLGTIDINGDGINEVIAQRTDYESTSFEIYEYKSNQLNRVFSGAGYGC
jgi:hypothetical protein